MSEVNTGSRTKRQKIERHEEREEEQAHQLSRLDRVPLEILAEILLYMNSPKDVLSVARCSKNLCATLLNPSNVMIWRRARLHCVVPDLPPPPPGWSESAYAALIFDGGNCYVRHRFTSWPSLRNCHSYLDLSRPYEPDVLVVCRPGSSMRHGLFFASSVRYLAQEFGSPSVVERSLRMSRFLFSNHHVPHFCGQVTTL
jgi:hypothetical protein